MREEKLYGASTAQVQATPHETNHLKITSNSLEFGGELTSQMHPHHSLLMEDPTTREKPVLSPHSERSVRFLTTGRGTTVTFAELGIYVNPMHFESNMNKINFNDKISKVLNIT